ncbi:MAG: hypothetical protein LBN12_05455 [Clostridiales Family XIII bacterium]|jgi:hypothetical protein|nr:hypothetical protein [Clostridiales Family XIII bacterium]
MSAETNTDLTIRADSLENRTGVTNTDLRIGQYEFFADNQESRYVTAAEGEQARLAELREEVFTPAFADGLGRNNVSPQVQQLSILETAPEYTQGLYDESGSGGTGTILLVLLFAGICMVTFFITRKIHGYKRKKAETCTSQ